MAKLEMNLQDAGDATNGTDGLWAKSSLRGKRSDPWHGANAASQALGDPVRSG